MAMPTRRLVSPSARVAARAGAAAAAASIAATQAAEGSASPSYLPRPRPTSPSRMRHWTSDILSPSSDARGVSDGTGSASSLQGSPVAMSAAAETRARRRAKRKKRQARLARQQRREKERTRRQAMDRLAHEQAVHVHHQQAEDHLHERIRGGGGWEGQLAVHLPEMGAPIEHGLAHGGVSSDLLLSPTHQHHHHGHHGHRHRHHGHSHHGHKEDAASGLSKMLGATLVSTDSSRSITDHGGRNRVPTSPLRVPAAAKRGEGMTVLCHILPDHPSNPVAVHIGQGQQTFKWLALVATTRLHNVRLWCCATTTATHAATQPQPQSHTLQRGPCSTGMCDSRARVCVCVCAPMPCRHELEGQFGNVRCEAQSQDAMCQCASTQPRRGSWMCRRSSPRMCCVMWCTMVNPCSSPS